MLLNSNQPVPVPMDDPLPAVRRTEDDVHDLPDWADLHDRLDTIPKGSDEDADSNRSHHAAIQRTLTYIYMDDCGEPLAYSDDELLRPDARV